MAKITKLAAFVSALCIGAAAMAGCGDKKENTKADEKDIESAIDSMDEKELESAIEEAAEKLDKEEEEKATVSNGYAQTEEIKNASFESGLIQIGNDVFRQGGYYTVNQLIEEFGDRYDFTELNPNGIYDEMTNCTGSMVSKTDSDNLIFVGFAPLNAEERTSVGECVVRYFNAIIDMHAGAGLWYPHYKDNMLYTDVEDFLNSLGYKKKEADNGKNEYDCYWYVKKSSNYPESYLLYVKGTEKNLFGSYPIYIYRYLIDVETGEVSVDFGGMLPQIWYTDTDEWSSAKESE